MNYKPIFEKVSQETGIPEEVVSLAYRTFWKFIRETITELPLKENLTEEEFNELNNYQKIADTYKNKMPEDEKLYDLAELFKVFGDTTRIKILYALFEEEMCVCDIADLLNMTQSAISHQLRVLKQARLVKFRKEGKIVYYSLDDDHIYQIYKLVKEHIEE